MLSPRVPDQQQALAEARADRDRAHGSRRALLAEKSQLQQRIAILPVRRRREELLQEPALATAAVADDGALTAQLRELAGRHAGVIAAAQARPGAQVERGLSTRRAEPAHAAGQAAAAGARSNSVRVAWQLADDARALADERRELTRALAERSGDASDDVARTPHESEEVPRLTEAQLAVLAERIELAERAGLAGLSQQAAELARRAALVARGAVQLGVTHDSAALTQLALPDEAQLAALEALSLRTQRAAERLQEGEARHASEAAELAQQRAALLAGGTLPSASDLAAARAAVTSCARPHPSSVHCKASCRACALEGP